MGDRQRMNESALAGAPSESEARAREAAAGAGEARGPPPGGEPARAPPAAPPASLAGGGQGAEEVTAAEGDQENSTVEDREIVGVVKPEMKDAQEDQEDGAEARGEVAAGAGGLEKLVRTQEAAGLGDVAQAEDPFVKAALSEPPVQIIAGPDTAAETLVDANEPPRVEQGPGGETQTAPSSSETPDELMVKDRVEVAVGSTGASSPEESKPGSELVGPSPDPTGALEATADREAVIPSQEMNVGTAPAEAALLAAPVAAPVAVAAASADAIDAPAATSAAADITAAVAASTAESGASANPPTDNKMDVGADVEEEGEVAGEETGLSEEDAKRELERRKKREATRRLRAKWKRPKEVSEFSRARPKRGQMGAAVEPVEPPVSKLAGMLLEGKRVVFITGAGLSVASGIPPFRGQDDAVWEESVYTWGTREKFEEDPLAWYNTFWLRHFDEGKASSYLPNKGHVALARICASYPETSHLITQNIDRLHRHTAGSISDEQLIEIHGFSGAYKCYSDKCPYALEKVWHAALGDKVHRPEQGRPLIRSLEDLPKCPECAEILCPNCLLFDEDYTDHESYQFEKAKRWFLKADAFVFVGTSFAVQITNLAFIAAASNQAPIFNFNMVDNVPEHFRLRVHSHFIPGPSEVTLPALADLVCPTTANAPSDL